MADTRLPLWIIGIAPGETGEFIEVSTLAYMTLANGLKAAAAFESQELANDTAIALRRDFVGPLAILEISTPEQWLRFLENALAGGMARVFVTDSEGAVHDYELRATIDAAQRQHGPRWN